MKIPDYNKADETPDTRNTQRLSAEQLNEHEHSMKTTIDQVCQASEQSYDQFMQNFVFLTPSDVKRPVKPTQNFSRPRTSRTPPYHKLADLAGLNSTLDRHVTARPEEMDEEVLQEGTRNRGIMLSQGKVPKSVQVDNFVCDESIDSDGDDDDTPSYTASFSRSGERCNQAISDIGDRSLDITSRIAKCLKPDENEEDLLDLINDSNGDTDDENGEDENDEDHDDDDEMINQHQLLSTFEEAAFSQQSTENEDLVYNPDMDLPNPGEVEEVSELSHSVNERTLAFSAKLAQSCPQIQVASESHIDDKVLPFSLDDDFDYDNVILTPKLSEEETQALKNYLTKWNEHS